MWVREWFPAWGIIPARAGFTATSKMKSVSHLDHPRSRGVYAASAATRCSASGSSPLARGLRSGRALSLDVDRIIPARAGFTAGGGCREQPGGDHPRSRGVYIPLRWRLEKAGGSSPLARGLPLSATPAGNLPGIIPARAGFTPLVLVGTADLGIIPARAGFTDAAHRAGGRTQDHPRSRGVYRAQGVRAAMMSGSSPLARGLRSTASTAFRPVRIIPARAGFTVPRGDADRGRPDHPRSRGVY